MSIKSYPRSPRKTRGFNVESTYLFLSDNENSLNASYEARALNVYRIYSIK